MIRPEDPRHGQRAGYIAGCREECCSVPHSRYQKRSRLRLLEEGTQIISSAKTMRRVAWWADRGVGINALCLSAGLGYGTLAEHMAGDRDVCLRTTERAIHAVTWDMLPPSTLVYSAMTQRRLYSLMASGHTLEWISDQVTTGLSTGGRWRKQERMYLSLARAVAEVARTAPATGPSLMSAAKVRRRGHLPLIDWEDPGNPAEPRGWEPERPDTDVVDDIVVERLTAGFRMPSTRAEKVEAMRRHLAAGNSELSLCLIHGWKPGRYVVREPERQDGAA